MAAPFFCEDIATPCTKRSPCSRGELISSRAMADNNGIATDPDFRCGAKRTAWMTPARRLGGGARWLRLSGEGAAARWKSLRAFHRLNRVRAGARCRGPGGQADAQVGELLEQGQAHAGGQAKDMAAAAAVGADKMPAPYCLLKSAAVRDPVGNCRICAYNSS